MINWNSEYSVNHPEIDKEHQSLFKLLNEFYRELQAGSSKEKMAGLIKGLLDYSKIHFSNEEEYMHSIGFPEVEAHKSEHDAFIQKATDFYNKYNSGRLLLSLEVTNFIKEWIANHIKTQDKKYAVFSEEK